MPELRSTVLPEAVRRTGRPGPLAGVRVLEIGGMGPGPFAGMALGDLGADVVRVERPGGVGAFPGDEVRDVLNRGKRSAVIDLKAPEGVEAVLALVERSDILLEGHRPGVCERLGIGPDVCMGRRPSLVYGRMTGWGQSGPLASTAGHDVNYIALTGALGAIGPSEGPPAIPLNLVGDFGGGGMYLVAGVLAALLEARATGVGQVVDAAIVDGTLHLLSAVHGLMNGGAWCDARGVNFLDGGAPYYNVYATSDGEYMAVGAIEPKFYRELIVRLQADIDPALQEDRDSWPATHAAIATAFRCRTQAEWTSIFSGTDACVAPVMTLSGAIDHPHIADRGSLVMNGGLLQSAPAPRFSGHELTLGTPPPRLGQHTAEVLLECGIDPQPLLSSGIAHDGSAT